MSGSILAAVMAVVLALTGTSAAPSPDHGVDRIRATASASADRAARNDASFRASGGLERLTVRLEQAHRRVGTYERIGRRLNRWWDCIDHLPVDQAGDRGHRWGFSYDEGDGTGLDTRTALVPHDTRKRPDLLLLRRSRADGCLSRAPDPNGTGADARVVVPQRSGLNTDE